MENVIEVQPRAQHGKGAARKLRATGKIPGVLYGHKEAPIPFEVDPTLLRKSLRSSDLGRNTVLTIRGLNREVLALVKDTQVDPVGRDVLHIDLIEVRSTDRVIVEVPVVLTGKSE